MTLATARKSVPAGEADAKDAMLGLRIYGPLVAAMAFVALALFALSFLSGSYVIYLVNLCIINSLCAMGLCVLAGTAGQLSLGTAAIQAIAAYTVGILSNHYGVPVLITLPLGALAATLVGTVLAIPALRLSGLHLPILTMAFGVVAVQLISKGGTFTGGTSGLNIPTAEAFGFRFNSDFRVLCLNAPIFAWAAWMSWVFLKLKPGRALRAIRFSPTAAQALGINTAHYNIIGFAFSSFIVGIGGVLYAITTRYISTDDFTLWNSVYFFVMIAVGGMTSIAGSVVGAIFVTLLPEFLRGVASVAPFILGMILILINWLLPGGLVSAFKMAREYWLTRRGLNEEDGR